MLFHLSMVPGGSVRVTAFAPLFGSPFCTVISTATPVAWFAMTRSTTILDGGAVMTCTMAFPAPSSIPSTKHSGTGAPDVKPPGGAGLLDEEAPPPEIGLMEGVALAQ